MAFDRIRLKANDDDAPAYEETIGEVVAPAFERSRAIDRLTAGMSRSAASVALSDTTPTSLGLMDELDELFRRNASEVEIAAFRARAEQIEGRV